MTTIHQRVAAARARLRVAGLAPAEADLSARLLAEYVLGWNTERFLTSADQAEPAGFAAQYEGLVARRTRREPLAYIIGRREFWKLDLEVSAAVLIPRPETELIVEAALELFPSRIDSPAIIDACTGSGCLAVAIASERPNAHIVATDISDVALDVGRRNARRHGVADRVHFMRADLLVPLEDNGPYPFFANGCDLIVANPPYVAERDSPGLQPEVRDHEPAVALFAGHDGLRMIARLIAEAPSRLRSGGFLVFEFGFGQDEHVERMLAESADFDVVELRRDLLGIARTAVAKRR